MTAAAPHVLLTLLLRPLVRFCLRRSLRIQDLLECAKRIFAEEARIEIAARGSTVTVSRLSVMTGIHRRDISRLSAPQQPASTRRHLITKVVGLWQTDRRFLTKAREPRILALGGTGDEFGRLVAAASKELNPATVLFELERVGAVERTDRGVSLTVQSYTPTGDVHAGFSILADDWNDLLCAVERNVAVQLPLPNLHARTTFDRIRPAGIPEIRAWLLREGHQFHARARAFLSQFDQDISPARDFDGPTASVVLGSFSRVVEEEEVKK